MSFKDHFSGVSAGYAAFRPHYPVDLFEWLSSLPGSRSLAWDCACGTGQATLALVGQFSRVIATDASEAQIRAAPRTSPAVEWKVAPAENSGLPAESVDLVTVAQALHWFDLPAFYREVKRVLRPDGVLAVWCYGINEVEDAALNEIAFDFYSNVVGPYWPDERKLVENGYRDLPFPFQEIEAPRFQMVTHWNLEQLLGYFRTWSATNRFIADRGEDPVNALAERLSPLWGGAERTRQVNWPLSLRVGRQAV